MSPLKPSLVPTLTGSRSRFPRLEARLLRTRKASSLIALAAFALSTAASTAMAQARPTATRLAEGQVGVSYEAVHSDYAPHYFNGYGIYADLDFKHHFGAEAEFHYASDQDSYVNVYERTYEIGVRYSRHYGRFQPYGKFMVGRGVFNAPFNTANLAYNLYAFGGGTDYRINRFLNARAEYEYQHWLPGSGVGQKAILPNGISPTMYTVGVAYRFK